LEIFMRCIYMFCICISCHQYRHICLL
jgi:hypothetical protein